jgi:hypothetical protein
LRRVRRRAEDAAAGSTADPGTVLRRYRCTAQRCAWEGLLPRRVRRPRGSWRRLWSRSIRGLLLPLLALSGLAAAMGAVAWQAGLLAPPAARLYARGEFHDGEPLPKAHPLSRHHAHARLQAAADAASAARPVPLANTLTLRYGCVWGQPGRSPYRGSVEQALRTAALPEELVQAVAAQIRSGRPTDWLEISNAGVRALGTGRTFSAQNIALTYGATLCLSSRVNFAEGHVEPAALYEATTARGQVVAVMVPPVCGNVSVLGQTADGPQDSLNALGVGDNPHALRWMPAILEGRNTSQADKLSEHAHDVPEPTTLACALAALTGLWLLRWWQRRRSA